MSKEEKIQLYELLGKYIDEIKPEIAKREIVGTKDKIELLALITMQNHVRVSCEIRDVLVLDF